MLRFFKFSYLCFFISSFVVAPSFAQTVAATQENVDRLNQSIAGAELENALINNDPQSKDAKAQIKINQDFKNQKSLQQLGKGGRVVVIFGQSVPELVCSPQKVCTIELSPHESLSDSFVLSDPLRWSARLQIVGPAESPREIIIIKPAEVGISANITLATTKRFYVVDLLSVDDRYTPILSFTYPDEDQLAILEHIKNKNARHAQVTAAKKQQKIQTLNHSGVNTSKGLTDAAKLNFNYSINGNADFAPVRVYDDGRKTYITLPERYKHRSKPILLVNSKKTVNVRVNGLQYQIDGIFKTASLTLDKITIKLRRN